MVLYRKDFFQTVIILNSNLKICLQSWKIPGEVLKFSKIESLPSIILLETNFFEDIFSGIGSLILEHPFDRGVRGCYFSLEFLFDVKKKQVKK